MEVEQIIQKIELANSFQYHKKNNSAFESFKMMKISSKETIHSRILSFLMKSNSFSAQNFWCEFKKIIKTQFPNDIWEKLPNNSSKIDVYTEYSFDNQSFEEHSLKSKNYLDVFIQTDHFAIAIENKIYAKEGRDQISRYQEYLSTRPEKFKFIIFLTLNGNKPLTYSVTNFSIPIICVSWNEIYMAIANSEFHNSEKSFVELFKAHLYKNFVMKTEMKNDCYDIFKQNFSAYKVLNENFNYCVKRNTKESFQDILQTISEKEDLKLLSHTGIEVIDDNNKGKYKITLRKDNWDKNISIIVYRFVALGVFPCINPVSERFAKYKKRSFVFGQERVSYFSEKYYSDIKKNNEKERWIKHNAIFINPEDIVNVVKQISKYQIEIDSLISETTINV